jgi:hypothetical protein
VKLASAATRPKPSPDRAALPAWLPALCARYQPCSKPTRRQPGSPDCALPKPRRRKAIGQSGPEPGPSPGDARFASPDGPPERIPGGPVPRWSASDPGRNRSIPAQSRYWSGT